MSRTAGFKIRRVIALLIATGGTVFFLGLNQKNWEYDVDTTNATEIEDTVEQSSDLAIDILEKLPVKGRAPKINYKRTEFYDNWPLVDGCSLRQKIIKRDFGDDARMDGCEVISGSYYEPYTGKLMGFSEKAAISGGIQIDHIVALSDAWQKGAQYKSAEIRYAIATDPLNLIAVDSQANQEKSDSDAASWLPANKSFRCQYVARQVSVKYKYELWVTSAEHDVIEKILSGCPDQKAYGVKITETEESN